MSGIVALVDAARGAVDARLLDTLTAALVRRGPDGTGTLVEGSVGMGHALLRTGADPTRDARPARLGRDLCITADVRIDARAELLRELRPHVPCDLETASDPALVLHAYRVWGEACVDHLLGDFAFALWDGRTGTLFCARDPFGVKLLYYASTADALIVSNTLACVRRHPTVSDALDPDAVGDLLVWGELQDAAATTFRDVRALPPGHTLSWSRGGAARVRRYWTLPPEQPAPRRARADVADEFVELLGAAVRDRLRTPTATVFMSGGVDSTLVAAAACDELERAGLRGGLRAATVTFDRLVPDRERRFSSAAADALGLPIAHFPLDDFHDSWRWLWGSDAPEPQTASATGAWAAATRAAASWSPVVLTGSDGDSLLLHSLAAHWSGRARRGELVALAGELVWHLRARRVPRLGLRSALARLTERAGGATHDGYPAWLARDFEREHALRERWRDGMAAPADARPTPRGPALRAFGSTAWRSVLDPIDPGSTGLPLEHRHPLLDVRLVRFALALPPVPWCVNKELFRARTRRVLPRAVADRPKEPVPGDPLARGLGRMREEPPLDLPSELGHYVDVPRYLASLRTLRAEAGDAAPLAFAAFNTYALAGWLRGPARTARCSEA